jgi:hypothetical protein
MTLLLTAERLDELAGAANAAPSADNRHVFRLAVEGETLCVLDAPALHEPPAHRRLLGLISVGAVVENLVLRGARLGLELQPEVIAAPQPGSPLVRFSVSAMPSAVLSDSMEAAIERRHSNRQLRFRGPKLSPEQQKVLAARCATVAGSSVVWLDEPVKRRGALELLRCAEAERFRNRTLHRELFQAIRFDIGWKAPSDLGLPPGALGLPAPEQLGFAVLRNWQIQRLGNFLGLHRLVGLRAADLPCRWAPHLLAVTTAGSGEPEAIRAGQALQRAWLSATAYGLAVQVYAAAGIYAGEGAVDVPPELRLELRRGWQSICPGRNVWLVMRLGRAPAPAVRTGRPAARLLWISAVDNEASDFFTAAHRESGRVGISD